MTVPRWAVVLLVPAKLSTPLVWALSVPRLMMFSRKNTGAGACRRDVATGGVGDDIGVVISKVQRGAGVGRDGALVGQSGSIDITRAGVLVDGALVDDGASVVTVVEVDVAVDGGGAVERERVARADDDIGIVPGRGAAGNGLAGERAVLIPIERRVVAECGIGAGERGATDEGGRRAGIDADVADNAARPATDCAQQNGFALSSHPERAARKIIPSLIRAEGRSFGKTTMGRRGSAQTIRNWRGEKAETDAPLRRRRGRTRCVAEAAGRA